MLESFRLWIIGKGKCSRCHLVFKKKELTRIRDYKYCKKCKRLNKLQVKNPKAYWNSTCCIYCKSKRIKMIHQDPNDHTGDVWKCYKCKNMFYGHQIDDSKKIAPRPKPTKKKNIALLRCDTCRRVFRQDNNSFSKSGTCPRCGYLSFELLRYVEPRKK